MIAFEIRENRQTYRIKKRGSGPRLESLEDRLLLYSATGGQWAFGDRITLSFVPDGTSVGGTPSNLIQQLDTRFARATWEAQFLRAAAVWQAVADVNFALVPDDGSPIGDTTGLQQGDDRYGDIRIGGYAMAGSALGLAFYPAPLNGGSLAGDVMINTSQLWQINSDYDLQTVAIHEIGHALGMGHSAITNAVMYAQYTGVKQALNADDTAGIRSIYGARAADAYDSPSPGNYNATNAASLNSMIDASGQVNLPGLDISSTSDQDWFKVTVPAGTTGTMVVTMQSTDLSLLSPRVQVYNASVQSLGFSAAAGAYGSTVTVSIGGVSPGQVYYVRATAANSGPTGAGGYGLQLNFGSGTQEPIEPPDTRVAAQQSQGGGSSNLSIDPRNHRALDRLLDLIGRGNEQREEPLLDVAIGHLSGKGDILEDARQSGSARKQAKLASVDPTAFLIVPVEPAAVTIQSPAASGDAAGQQAPARADLVLWTWDDAIAQLQG